MKRRVRSVCLIVLTSGLASGCSARREREAILKQSLFMDGQAIDTYTLDKERAPQSLQDLVNEHYLKEIPTDPFTRKRDWVPKFADIVLNENQTTTGIDDVHSNSTQVGSNGIAYNSSYGSGPNTAAIAGLALWLIPDKRSCEAKLPFPVWRGRPKEIQNRFQNCPACGCRGG